MCDIAKALPDAAKVVCKAPSEGKLAAWCIGWAKAAHKKKLAADAAERLLERVGPAMGLLAQELDKLAVAVTEEAPYTIEIVEPKVPMVRAGSSCGRAPAPPPAPCLSRTSTPVPPTLNPNT